MLYAVHLYTKLVRAQTLQCHAFIQISDAICSVQSHGIKMQHIALQMQIISHSGLHDWEGIMKWAIFYTHEKKKIYHKYMDQYMTLKNKKQKGKSALA